MSHEQDALFEVNRTRGRVVQTEDELTDAKIAATAAGKALKEALNAFETAIRMHERIKNSAEDRLGRGRTDT